MDAKTLGEFKALLETRLFELLSGLYGPVSRLAGADKAREPMDLADMASHHRDMELLNTFRYRNHKLIKEILAAVRRIQDGDFGVCVECEEPIAPARLRAHPTTLFCVQCQRTEEAVRLMDAVPHAHE